MAKKTTDPFMATLWSGMLEEKLPPGGHETSWGVTSPRIRNRFIRAVRQAMQSGAAFQASAMEKVPVYPLSRIQSPGKTKTTKKTRR